MRNKLYAFKYASDDLFLDKLVARMDQNQDIFEKIPEDKDFGDLIKDYYMRRVFRRMNEAG